MATTVTIACSANAIGCTLSRLNAAMAAAAVPAESDLLHMLGCTIQGDSVANVGLTKVVRTIILRLNRPPLLSSFKNNPLPRARWSSVTGFQGSIVSSSDEDSPTGSGTRTVNLSYLDSAGNPQTENAIALQGRTPVNLTNTDKVTLVDLVQAAGGAEVNMGRLTIYSGTTSAKPGYSVPVAVLVQPPYRLSDTATMGELFKTYMQRKLRAALGIPVFASVPVFA